jgi:5'-3' exonuclease
MDTLTFDTPILLRHLTFSEAKKQPILEVDLKKALDGLDMTMSQVLEATSLVAPTFSNDSFLQFIELCLLLGCDYLEPIKGIGPKTAYKLMQEHGSLDEVLEHLKAKYAPHDQYLKWCGLLGDVGLLQSKTMMQRVRKKGAASKYLKNGHGKKQRNSSRILMSLQLTSST